MRNQKERKSVKVRLAPLPIRNLNLGNTLNLEECLNRSVAMDRPLSRMSDLSNFSGNSMISVARSNYEIQSDELRRQSNRNLIEALRSKDIRRRRNYLNNNQDNYSVDLNFNRSQPNINYQQNNQQQIKRKRDIYDDDEESELNYGLFNSNNKTTKFARTDNLQIPSKNRFISSQYKNNEIASSYYSIKNPTNQLNNSNQFKSNTLLKRSLSNQDLENNKKIFKVPLIIHSNSSSKENTLNVSNTINLSNPSISPINKNNNSNQLQTSINLSSNSSALFKSLNNSSNEMSVDNKLNSKDNSNNKLSIDNNLEDKNTNDDSFTEVKVRDDYNYKIPEHFHSIDEHIRDENKAKGRLAAFLDAICNVTKNSLLPNFNKTDSNSTIPNAESNKDKNNTQTSSILNSNSATVTTSSLFNPVSSNNSITTTTATDTKTNNSSKPATQFKFPTISESKSTDSGKTSTPSKVTFNLPNSTLSTLNKNNTITNATNNDSSIFKFGQTTNDQTNTKIETSKNLSGVFKFGDTGNLDKPKESTATTSMFTLPQTTTATTNTKFNIQNLSLSFTNKENNSTSLNNNTLTNNKSFGTTNLGSSFTLPTTNSTAISNLPSNSANSVFTFGKDSQTATTLDKTQDLNKSSYVFKFGNTTSTATNAISTTTDKPATSTAPVFNFGQSSNLPQQQQNISNSGFNFSASIAQNNLNNSLSTKPASTPFTFDNLNTNQQIDQSINKPTNQSLNFSFTQPDKPKENAGYNFNLNANTNLNNSISSKPVFNFGAPANNFISQTTSTPFKFENNNFNQINKPPSINFGLTSQTNTNQLKPATQNPPSFNFASTKPPNSFQFGAQSTISNKPENSFTSSTFNFNPSTSNIFTIGKK